MVGAYEEGVLSRASMDALTEMPEIGDHIAAGLGASAHADFLVTVMPDDSSSIATAEMQDAVRSGHNLVLSVARENAATNSRFGTRYLNGRVLTPYTVPARASAMTTENYPWDPGGTPLYDQSVVLLGTVIAKCRDVRTVAGVDPRTFTVIITDGADTASQVATPQSVKWLIADMNLTGNHIVAGMGINDGTTDFARVFTDMGIPRGWVLTPAASPKDIARAFRTIAQAVELGARSGEAFRLLAAGPPRDAP
jgi:hypothetical protein